MVGHLADVITRMQNFKLKFFGFTILQGVEFSIFLLIFAWVLQQCSATALSVIIFIFFNRVGNVPPGSGLVKASFFGRWKCISLPNFDEISQSTADTILRPVSENGRPPYWNFLFPFSISTHV